MTDDREARIRAAVEALPVNYADAWNWHVDPNTGDRTGELSLDIKVPELERWLRDLLTEAEERGFRKCADSEVVERARESGKWVECPECRDGIGCATCGELDTAARGRIRRELAGALWMAYYVPANRRDGAKQVACENWGER